MFLPGTFSCSYISMAVSLVLYLSVAAAAAEPPDRYIVTFESEARSYLPEPNHKKKKTANVLSIAHTAGIESAQPLVTRILDTGGHVEHTLGLANSLIVSGYRSKEQLAAALEGTLTKGYSVRKDRIAKLDFFTPDTVPASLYNRPSSYSLAAINAQDAWHYSKGESVLVAVIDSGVSPTNELSGRIKYNKGISMIGNVRVGSDALGHGTHVACSIAGSTCGVAPKCHILPITAINSSGHGYESDALSAVNYALLNGASVINMSLGWSPDGSDHSAWKHLLDRAEREGVVIVAATGNNTQRGISTDTVTVRAPAIYSSVIAVGATDRNNQAAAFSLYRTSRGTRVDLCAPGVDVRSFACGGYRMMSGTSMAAPHVSGTVALMLATDRKSKISPVTVKDILVTTASGTKGGPQYGAGVVNALEAVTAVRSRTHRPHNNPHHDHTQQPNKPNNHDNSDIVKTTPDSRDMDAVETLMRQHLKALRALRVACKRKDSESDSCGMPNRDNNRGSFAPGQGPFIAATSARLMRDFSVDQRITLTMPVR
jgi:hypothetical protein